MFGKLVQHTSFYGKFIQTSRSIFVSLTDFSPRKFGRDSPRCVEETTDDAATAAEIESNLFENTENLYKPVNSSELLKKYKLGSQKTHKKTVAIKEKKSVSSQSKNPTTKKESSPIIKNTDLGMEYLKLGLNDPLLSKLFLSAKSRKYRDKNNQIIVEGRRLILEAIEANCKIETLFFSQKEQLNLIKDAIKKYKDVKIIKVPQQNLKVWSTLTTCPGLIAIFNRPDNSEEFPPPSSSPSLPITVVCDNIREPNNLGSVIRSCAAIPCSQVLVLKGCCDPWETKALRGGSGGQFRIKIKDNISWENLEEILPENYSIFIAENNLNKLNNVQECPIVPYNDVIISNSHNVLVIGGETYGISENAYKFLIYHKEGSCLHIPLAKGVDSLNTAAALTLILFEMRKLIIEKQLMDNLQLQSTQLT